ncbi:MAG: hypothetical protein HY889_00420 [Deltaproteobacteria bacterium]|nr:hypothetical protein [Deltaproteobacteria bacterium]
MAVVKKIISDWSETGKTVYCIVRREADSFLLNSVDGTFVVAPANPYLALTEHATIKGRYEASESRTVWMDGRYTVAIYKQAGGSPAPASDTIIGSGELVIENDLEVYLDKMPSFIHKWILNKLVESPAGTWKLYDNDNVTVLKTWTWDGSARIRSRAV